MAENVAATAQYNPAVAQLVTDACRDLAIIDDEETPTGAMYTAFVERLNQIVKTLQATGIHVWTEEEAMLFLQKRIPEYLFSGTSAAVASGGNNMVAMCCDADGFQPYALAQSYFTGATVLELTAAPFPYNSLLPGVIGIEGGGIIGLEQGGELGLEQSYGVNEGDNFGVVMADGSMFWTTVAQVAGSFITIAGPLPGPADLNAFCFDYPPSSQVSRPLMVPRARLFTYQGAILNPMTRLSRQEYMDLPQTLNPGTPTQHFYTPQRGIGRFYVWPNVQQCNWGVRFTYYRSLADLLTPANTMDFPQEWIMPLRWILARDAMPGYSVPPGKAQLINSQADSAMAVVAGWDRESEDVQFGMDWRFR